MRKSKDFFGVAEKMRTKYEVVIQICWLYYCVGLEPVVGASTVAKESVVHNLQVVSENFQLLLVSSIGAIV